MIRHALTALIPVTGILFALAEWVRLGLENMR
jgi:hypothetical protein